MALALSILLREHEATQKELLHYDALACERAESLFLSCTAAAKFDSSQKDAAAPAWPRLTESS